MALGICSSPEGKEVWDSVLVTGSSFWHSYLENKNSVLCSSKTGILFALKIPKWVAHLRF